MSIVIRASSPAPQSTAFSRVTRQRDLMTHLVGREFRLRYRRSALGWLWSIAQPLARLLILSFIFTQVIPLNIDNYPVFLYSGLVVWVLFSSGVNAAASSVLDRSDLLLRPGLPRSILPVISVIGDSVDYLLALPVLLTFVVVGGIGLTPALVYLPILLVAEFLLVLGIGFALSPLQVRYRDVSRFIDVVMLLGFYATPVFYDPEEIPDGFRWLVDWNPMAHILRAHRSVILDGQWPGTPTVLGLLALGLGSTAAGLAIYRRSSPGFIDEL